MVWFRYPREMDLEGKTAVITGASSGLGRAIAIGFAERNAKAVIIADRDEAPREGGDPTAVEITNRSETKASFVACDVTAPDQVAAAIAEAERHGPLSIFVNNAGVVGPMTDLVELDDDAIETVLAVNVKGVLYGCRAAARAMIPHGQGSIINLSSVVALAGSARASLYSASKGAVTSLTRALAAELGPKGIRVNALHPGMVETMMTMQDQSLAEGKVASSLLRRLPLRELGIPSQIADAAAFLASDESSYMTGTATVVDGGWSAAL